MSSCSLYWYLHLLYSVATSVSAHTVTASAQVLNRQTSTWPDITCTKVQATDAGWRCLADSSSNQVPPASKWPTLAITSTMFSGWILIFSFTRTAILLVDKGQFVGAHSTRETKCSCLFGKSIWAWCFFKKSRAKMVSAIKGSTDRQYIGG